MFTFRLEHAVPHTLARPLVIAIALMLATPTFAADFTIVDGQTVTTQQVLDGTAGSNTGAIETGGALTVTGSVIDGISASGTGNTITNSGTITADYDVIYSVGSGATITNSGSISSRVYEGIHSEGAGDTITNSGTITAADDGIRSLGANTIINNSGSISSRVYDGIRSIGANAIITNSGTITPADDGIQSNGANAIITNSGTITAADDGIRSNGDDSIITNSGTIITTTITTTDDQSGAMTLTGANAIITNSGTITAADYGIRSLGANTIIKNSGTITAADSGIGCTIGIGCLTESLGANTIINNSGHITGTNYAIAGGTSDTLTLNLLKGSQLMGAIDLRGAGDNDTVNIHGGSVSATLTLLNTENINLLGPGLKLSGDVVVSVDGTAEAARSVVLSTITSDIHDQIAQRIHLPAAPQPVKGVTSTVLPGLQFKQHEPVAWMQVWGGDSDRDAEDDARAYGHDYVGITGGYEWDLGQRRVGLVGGVVNSDTDGNENSFKSDTEHFYLGAYTSQQLQGFTLTTSLLGGYGRHDNERLVIDNLNGREVAKSDFNSLFISPSVTIASAYKIHERVELRPSASVNYSIAWLDDHSERGTTQSNLSVDDRQIQALSTKLQVAAAYAYSATSEFELRTGVSSRYTDDDDTEISIGGSKSKFSNVGDENVYSSFVGARLRIASNDQLSLVADVELGGNGDEDYKAGHLSVVYTFH